MEKNGNKKREGQNCNGEFQSVCARNMKFCLLNFLDFEGKSSDLTKQNATVNLKSYRLFCP